MNTKLISLKGRLAKANAELAEWETIGKNEGAFDRNVYKKIISLRRTVLKLELQIHELSRKEG